ncbi:pantoate--beta-alanine ligase [Tateyamaria sp. ANG-S1]|uniref:pantoate--beta-alanine ligase n=1 Tax=Tateyamaria sp. ANG-S1 TaxID=1577905 RepID=UPI00057CF48B|nr:pantoate--beta-alanine ligase [Tateyamaria sp. ANG-S1]KIC47866.1 pantoate--beta-alanine ligase [Tateyamaria sp. ANG-S1]
MTAPIVRTLAELRQMTRGWQRAGETIGVVPTMGALHDGHLSLVARAKEMSDRVIVTIFVNPKQFNNPEDLANYPRTEHEDARKLERFAVDAIYVPDGAQMYPDGFATTVSVDGLTNVLCGAHRPGHFDGVATIVTKLFTQTSADLAFFGEKDFQQLQVVRRLARDLDLGVKVVGCPTIREIDGLAMSSRNLLLSDQARSRASALNEVMEDMVDQLGQGASMADLLPNAEARLAAAGFGDIDYLEMRTNDTFSLIERAGTPARLFAAVYMAGVRLIDNIDVPLAR